MPVNLATTMKQLNIFDEGIKKPARLQPIQYTPMFWWMTLNYLIVLDVFVLVYLAGGHR